MPHFEQPRTIADVVESVETMVARAEHPLLDGGKILDRVHADAFTLELRDGSLWEVRFRQVRRGQLREVDEAELADVPCIHRNTFETILDGIRYRTCRDCGAHLPRL